jgi:MFS family permease
MSATQWLICAVAGIGFMFDTFTLLVLTLVVQPALMELTGARPGSPAFNHWVGMLFYIPAVAGGIFGLMGGYLIDIFGRRRMLILSILLPAVSTVATAFVRTAPQLLFLRSLTFIGVAVEFVAATAWLAELFSDRKRRESVLGYTQGLASTGGIVVSAAYYLAVTYSGRLPAIYGAHQAWRYTLVAALFPVIPVLAVLPFLPESPVWLEERSAPHRRRPSISELFHPRYRGTVLLTTLMMACAYAASFGMLQHFARIIPGTPGVRGLSAAAQQQRVGAMQGAQEMGGLAGRFILAFLAVHIVNRQKLLRLFQIPSLLLIPLVLFLPAKFGWDLPVWGICALGLVSVAQFSFWGNYLPMVYPTHLRGTAESFSANIGGRMLGTSAALITTGIVHYMPGSNASIQLAWAAGFVGLAACLVGFIASFWLPQPEYSIQPD